MGIAVKLIQEEVTKNEPAQVLIYQNEQLIYAIEAKIETKKGLDGKEYPCVTLQVIV